MAKADGGAGGGEIVTCDLCVIGAGSGGLSVAAAAAAFGEKVVLVERHKMGGDCLNTGCVPSKALIAAAKRAHAMRTSGPFGITPVEPEIDPGAVNDHVKRVIAAIAPNDSMARFTGLGVKVIKASARFLDRDTVEAGGNKIRGRRFVVATGSTAAVPPIPGLKDVAYLTNETIFDVREAIRHLIVIGGGPIGMELAQAHRRLGARVTVLEGLRAMGKDDPELAGVVLEAVRREGVVVREGAKVESVAGEAGAIRVRVPGEGGSEEIVGTHLLVAAGRRPNLDGLDLEKAGVAFERAGIKVDRRMQTSNPKVMAIGDCTGGLQFTHVANYHAGIVIRRALFRMPAKADTSLVPWVTYTDPELAQVGLTEAQALEAGHAVSVLRWPFRENDRAQAERETEGFVKVIVGKKGRILGAGIVGPQAGELVGMWTLAITQGLTIKAMTDVISPYPTLSEVNKRAATRYYVMVPGKPLVRRMIAWLKRLG